MTFYVDTPVSHLLQSHHVDDNGVHRENIDVANSEQADDDGKESKRKALTKVNDAPERTEGLGILDLDHEECIDKDNYIWKMGSVMICGSVVSEEEQKCLSPFHCYLRQNVFELFAAGKDDATTCAGGRQRPVVIGQVGVRCVFCKDIPSFKRKSSSKSFPGQISYILHALRRMCARHIRLCPLVPNDVLQTIDSLSQKVKYNAEKDIRGSYWMESAHKIGLVDRPEGIRFWRKPQLPPLEDVCLPVFIKARTVMKNGKPCILRELESENQQKSSVSSTTPSIVNKKKRKAPENAKPKSEVFHHKITKQLSLQGSREFFVQDKQLDSVNESRLVTPVSVVEFRPIVFLEDKHLIPEYLYLVLEQMIPSKWTAVTTPSTDTTIKMSQTLSSCTSCNVFSGFACKYCIGHGVIGRFFPATKSSLLHPGLAHAITRHISMCASCPREIRHRLDKLLMRQEEIDCEELESADVFREEDLTVFIDRIWSRIQNVL